VALLFFQRKIESRHSTIVQWLTVFVAMLAIFSVDCISLDNDLANLKIKFATQTVSIIKTLVDKQNYLLSKVKWLYVVKTSRSLPQLNLLLNC
jgi:hypothetical protein